jgi:transcriptional regulator with XRE-family HTH domain
MISFTSYRDVIDVLDRLPDLVRQARHRRNLTLRDTATLTGVSLNTLSRFERRAGFAYSDAVIRLVHFVADEPMPISETDDTDDEVTM